MSKQKLDKNIFVLGMVSFFTDISSEMIYPLLPLFLSSTLGVGAGFIGLIEGIAESTASILKVFSGWFSDRLKKRKPIIFCGYFLSTIGKPLLYFASLGWHVLAVRVIDRLGKGLRTAPRDALIADSCLPQDRGKAFGIQRAMDSAGAFLGPLAAYFLLSAYKNNYRLIFIASFFPAIIAVLVIAFFLKEKQLKSESIESNTKIDFFKIKNFSREFKIFILIVSIFTLGNSSDAFLILRAKNLGVSTALIPIIWLAFNFVNSASSYPLGKMSDIIGRRKTILIGFLIYSFVYFGFAFAKEQYQVWALMSIYGLYYGLSEGALRAYVADVVNDPNRRGTAYGIFNMAIGIFMLPASFLMGIFWQLWGPVFAFTFGALLSLLAAVCFVILPKKP